MPQVGVIIVILWPQGPERLSYLTRGTQLGHGYDSGQPRRLGSHLLSHTADLALAARKGAAEAAGLEPGLFCDQCPGLDQPPPEPPCWPRLLPPLPPGKAQHRGAEDWPGPAQAAPMETQRWAGSISRDRQSH